MRWTLLSSRPLNDAMPLVPELEPLAGPLWVELSKLQKACNGWVDFFFYNVGTAISLLASGSAAVAAAFNRPLLAASLSAVATFFVAMTRILNFGSRWISVLNRRAEYATMIYRLNRIPIDHQDRNEWPTAVSTVFNDMIAERRNDGQIPGAPTHFHPNGGDDDVLPRVPT